MKKHKYKAGDVVYLMSCNYDHDTEIIKVRIHAFKANNVCIVGPDADWFVGLEDLYPTPEACAQALVDEFYLTNPKTKCDYCSSRSDNLAGTPYISDIGKKMCKTCWGVTPTEEVFPK